MMDFLKKIIGTKNDRDLKALKPLVQEINEHEAKMKAMSDSELQAQTNKFKERLQSGAALLSILPEAFATVREASIRTLGMRHFDVQMMGGIVLFQNKISEMKTGEGKTLTATLPLYVHGLSGKGAHVVTVNDYLANRDANDMGRLFKWLGLNVGCILTNMSDEERKTAYAADITYGTNNEFAFDYLRDNMKFSLEDYVQRAHNFCIVDEVDSILIDEARTPLLISGPSEGDVGLYQVSNKVIPQLTVVEDYTVDEKAHSAVFTDAGITKIQKIMKIENLFNIQNSDLLHHLHQSLKAHALFKMDVNYVIKDGKVVIVDEFTGRLKEGSRWSDGLHQSVEAKEGVEVRQENQTLASITFQNYFRLYENLAGMTGTADTEAEEFKKIYNLDVVVVPTNVPMIRVDEADVIYKTKNAKMKAITKLIQELNAKGQPALVGTISIENSEIISNYLKKMNVPHEVLNAKNHAREAEIIVNAGQKGSCTIATNMAGRGTDIKLSDDTRKLDGLYIVGTERHESRRIDNQLRGRSGRQGDPGHSKFFLSLEDDLMRIFGSDRIKGIMTTMGMEDDEPIEHNMISNAIARAQKKVEAHNFEIRKHLLEYDNVMNEQRRVIYRLRKEILSEQDNFGFIKEMIEDVVLSFTDNYRPAKKVPIELWPWVDLTSGYKITFNTERDLTVTECATRFSGDIENYISSITHELIEEKFKKYEPEQVSMALREILLSIFDHHWKDHLLSMDHLKEGINLRAYAQKDPLTEYKREAFRLFEDMRMTVKKAVTDQIFRVQLYSKEEIEELKRKQEAMLEAQLQAHRKAMEAAQKADERISSHGEAGPSSSPVRRTIQKVGRNDVCPCGSGKKYKHCHGA